MEKQEILTRLNAIFTDVLDADIVLTESSSAADIEEWDSLNHIQLVVAIEKKFGIKFTTQEIQNWKNVGDIMQSIVAQLSRK
jgi:acyl carrier protein